MHRVLVKTLKKKRRISERNRGRRKRGEKERG
jgi:hypothetical protein